MKKNMYKKIMIVTVLSSSIMLNGCVSTEEVSTDNTNLSKQESESSMSDTDMKETVDTPVDYDFNEDYVDSAQLFLSSFAESFDNTHEESFTMGYNQNVYLDSIVEKSGKIPFFQVYHGMQYNYLVDLVHDLSDDLKKDLVVHIDDYNEDIKEFFDYDKLSNEQRILIYLANVNNHFFYDHTLKERLDSSEINKKVDYDSLFDSASFVFVNNNKVDVLLEELKSLKDYETKEDFLLHYYSELQLVHVEDDNKWFINPNSFVELSLMENKPRL